MAILVTGGTGYIGSYVVERLLRETDYDVALLTRAADYDAAVERVWRAMQLHFRPDEYHRLLERLSFLCGDLSQDGLGLSTADTDWAISNVDSIVHSAAALNFRSEKACMKHNLRGTLGVVNLARAIHNDHPLRRFTQVSTVAVVGKRPGETILEDEQLDWNREHYNPYTRTKMFCEHLVRELLPDVPALFVRPSSVIGDSRFPETTQFDMVRAFCALSDMPVSPLSRDARIDIVNADWVGRSIADLHVIETLPYDTFHLSSGNESRSIGEIGDALSHAIGQRQPRFEPRLMPVFQQTMNVLAALPRAKRLQKIGSLLQVFLPYVNADTVYDNRRTLEALGTAPTPFTSYGADLYRYAKSVHYEYPYVPLPDRVDLSDAPPERVRLHPDPTIA